MTNLLTNETCKEFENTVLDLVDYFNKHYSNKVTVESEFDVNALLNTIYFNMRNSKSLKVDSYDFYNCNSYASFSDDGYNNVVEDNKIILELMNKLYEYVGNGCLKASLVYPLSDEFIMDNDNVFHPNRVFINRGKFNIYGTQNRELLKASIWVNNNNLIEIEGKGTELFCPSDDNDKYSDYALSYLDSFFNVIDLKVKKINYKPCYPVITVVKQGE